MEGRRDGEEEENKEGRERKPLSEKCSEKETKKGGRREKEMVCSRERGGGEKEGKDGK